MSKINETKLRNLIQNMIKEETLDFKKYLRPNNVIDLGDDNGWNDARWDLYKSLKAHSTGKVEVKDLNSRGTYRQFSFPIKMKGKKYTVISASDSSD